MLWLGHREDDLIFRASTADRDAGRAANAGAASAASQAKIKSFSGQLFTARVPARWQREAVDERQGDFLHSEWRDPKDPNTAVIIDAVENETTDPAEKASDVRDVTAQAPDYDELSFGPVTVAGSPAYRWMFRVSGDQRVDY